jgi:hypothetical protein
MNIITKTFLFSLSITFLFSLIYYNIEPNNFQTMANAPLTYVDCLFYSVTIQCGVGLPDIKAVSETAKVLAMLQQLILMATAFIVLQVFMPK